MYVGSSFYRRVEGLKLHTYTILYMFGIYTIDTFIIPKVRVYRYIFLEAFPPGFFYWNLFKTFRIIEFILRRRCYNSCTCKL